MELRRKALRIFKLTHYSPFGRLAYFAKTRPEWRRMIVAALVALLASATPAAPAVPARPDRSRHAHALANLASYIIPSDYPPVAVRNHEQGTVRFEVDVTPVGRVAACRTLVSSGSRLLDISTCQVMVARARFDPARDADGHGVAETVRGRIRWVLPD